MRDTYTIHSTDELGPHLEVITETRIGLDTFVDCRSGDRVVTIPFGVPMCAGCDEAVGPMFGSCSCETVH